MKPTDRLLLGSVGKTYASAVALQMIHEKKFSLDDTLDKFFGKEPWFPRIAHGSAMTVRHLMTHTSGLVRYEFNPKFTQDLSANPDKVWTGVDRLSYLFDAKPPFAPGAGLAVLRHQLHRARHDHRAGVEEHLLRRGCESACWCRSG